FALMGRALSASAEGERRPSPAFLHGKIMSAVRAAEPGEAPPVRGRLAWAVAVACLLFAGLVWLRRPAAPVPNAGGPTELALNVSLPAAARVDQWPLDRALEQETQFVIADAKAAIDSLKNSFLPDAAEGSPHGPN